MRLHFLALAVAALLLPGGCASRPPADDPEAVAEFRQENDPAQPTNRVLYTVHEGIDTLFLRPAAELYRIALPPEVRTGVRNVLGNLRSPVILMNDVLQGQPQRAGDTLGRFLINSTLGIGGIFDIAATRFNIPGHAEDFGQTLAVWGVGEGPYIFMPALGPTNPRDLLGAAVDIVSNPLTWLGQGAEVDALNGVRTGATVVDTREGVIDVLDMVNSTSLDPYTTIRSAYRQRRQAEIENRLDRAAASAAGGTGFGVGTGVPASNYDK